VDARHCWASFEADVLPNIGLWSYPTTIVYPLGQLDTWFTGNLVRQPRAGSWREALVRSSSGSSTVRKLANRRAWRTRASRVATARMRGRLVWPTPCHAEDWGWGLSKVSYLDQVFPLLSRCLHHLRPPDTNDAWETRKGTATHCSSGDVPCLGRTRRFAGLTSQRRPPFCVQSGDIKCFECSNRPCDQIDCKRRWSLIMHWYNTGMYPRGAATSSTSCAVARWTTIRAKAGTGVPIGRLLATTVLILAGCRADTEGGWPLRPRAANRPRP
jgi:hypothetical protein